jgi:hypothetical protein
LDAVTLQSWLSEIKTWMDKNTNDVVTVLLVNSDNASPSDLGLQFSASGIDKLAYTPPSTSTIPKAWPTLDTLIGNNTRLITFVASLSQPSSQYPYLMDEFTFISAAFSSGRMFFMNHFLYANQIFNIQSPNETYANITNAQAGLGSLGTSVQECTGVYGKPPTFVLVDWFNTGPAIASVDAANGVTGATGRTNVSAQAVTPQNSGGVGRRQGDVLAIVVAVVVAVAFGS